MFDWMSGEQVVKKVMATTFIKKKLNVVLMMMVTAIVRLHLGAVLSYCLSFNWYLDFLMQIAITILLAVTNDWLYEQVTRYERPLYQVTKYLINHYSPESFRRWKLMCTLSVCGYLLLGISLMEINNRLLLVWIVQYLISYLLIDTIEQKRLNKLINTYMDRPTSVIYGSIDIDEQWVGGPSSGSDRPSTQSHEAHVQPDAVHGSAVPEPSAASPGTADDWQQELRKAMETPMKPVFPDAKGISGKTPVFPGSAKPIGKTPVGLEPPWQASVPPRQAENPSAGPHSSERPDQAAPPEPRGAFAEFDDEDPLGETTPKRICLVVDNYVPSSRGSPKSRPGEGQPTPAADRMGGPEPVRRRKKGLAKLAGAVRSFVSRW